MNFFRPSPAGLRRGPRRLRAALIGVLGVAVLLLVARLALPTVLRHAINHRLDNVPDYGGHVADVSLSLYRGAYHLHGMEITKRNGRVREPFFSADDIDFSIAWRELLHRRVVSDIFISHPRLTFVKGATQEATQLATDRRWQDAINDIFPISITFLQITEGQLRYIDTTSKPGVDVKIDHTHAVATGLRNRSEEEGDALPAKISLTGETIGSGQLRIDTQAEPLAKQPHFLLKLEVKNVSLPAMNDLLRAHGNIDVSAGVFDGYLEMTARDGRYSGYFKPFFQHVDFSPLPGESRSLGRQVWETLVHGFALIFKNHSKDHVATRIPFSGEFGNIDVGIWQTFVNLARNGFIQALPQKLDSEMKVPANAAPAAH